jgi:hypothetical protein
MGRETAEPISPTHQKKPTHKGTERPPPIIMTASVNF